MSLIEQRVPSARRFIILCHTQRNARIDINGVHTGEQRAQITNAPKTTRSSAPRSGKKRDLAAQCTENIVIFMLSINMNLKFHVDIYCCNLKNTCNFFFLVFITATNK